MKANEKIINRRKELNLTSVEVACDSGLTIHEYDDIEDYEDEIISVVPLSSVKALCRVLSIDIYDLLDLSPDEINTRTFSYSGSVLLRRSRQEKGLSQEQLSDMIGIHCWSIKEIESDVKNLDKWVIVDVMLLAKALGIPVTLLLS